MARKKASTPAADSPPKPTSSTDAEPTPSSTTTGASTSTASAAHSSPSSTPSKHAHSSSTASAPAGVASKKSIAATHQSDIQQVVASLWEKYIAETPQRVKCIDAFMAFLVLLGAVQFLYVLVVGNYPFNAFLAGFSATVGQFVLTASLRIQTNPQNKAEFVGVGGDERAFADFVAGSLILHVLCVNFIN